MVHDSDLVTTKEYFADVMHLKPFYFDPNYVTPLNIATRDTDESVATTDPMLL